MVLLHSKLLELELLLVYLLVLKIVVAQPHYPQPMHYSCMNDTGNYTANSKYKANLDTLLDNIISNKEIDYGFYNFSYGEDHDRVNAIGLCRGEVQQDECLSCLNQSRGLLSQTCPSQKEAIVWYDICMLRYSNRSIFGHMEDEPLIYLSSTLRVKSSAIDFIQVLIELLKSLSRKAASGSSLEKYAAGKATAPESQIIYAVVQCTPDLSEGQCNTCLQNALSDTIREGGKALAPSCFSRYENYPFYNLSADPQAVSPSTSPVQNNTTTTKDMAKLDGGDNLKYNRSMTSVVLMLNSFSLALPAPSKPAFLITTSGPESSEASATKFSILDSAAGKEINGSEHLQFLQVVTEAASGKFSVDYNIGKGGIGEV